MERIEHDNTECGICYTPAADSDLATSCGIDVQICSSLFRKWGGKFKYLGRVFVLFDVWKLAILHLPNALELHMFYADRMVSANYPRVKEKLWQMRRTASETESTIQLYHVAIFCLRCRIYFVPDRQVYFVPLATNTFQKHRRGLVDLSKLAVLRSCTANLH